MSKFIKNFSFSPFFILLIFFSVPVFAQSLGSGLPALNITDQGNGETTYSLSLQILALMTALTVLPSLVSVSEVSRSCVRPSEPLLRVRVHASPQGAELLFTPCEIPDEDYEELDLGIASEAAAAAAVAP